MSSEHDVEMDGVANCEKENIKKQIKDNYLRITTYARRELKDFHA
jgi:leucyl-tRNA synthetase